MESTRSLLATATGGVGVAREHQTTIFERLREIHQKVERHDPVAPSVAIFCCVLALSALGMLVQASHAATTLAPAEFTSELLEQVLFRTGGIAVMLLAARIGMTASAASTAVPAQQSQGFEGGLARALKPGLNGR